MPRYPHKDAVDRLIQEEAERMADRDRTPKCKHTPCPSGYVAWHEWAERKAKTHDQHRCPTCGRWAIWKRRKA